MKVKLLIVLMVLIGFVSFAKDVTPVDFYDYDPNGHYVVGSKDYSNSYGVIFALVKKHTMDMKIVLFKEEKDQIKFLSVLVKAKNRAPDFTLLECLDVLESTVESSDGYMATVDIIDGSQLKEQTTKLD